MQQITAQQVRADKIKAMIARAKRLAARENVPAVRLQKVAA